MAADGTLYQSSIAGGWIAAIIPSGEVSEYAGGLSAPVSIALGEDGSLFVACCGDNTVAKVAIDGTVSTFAAELPQRHRAGGRRQLLHRELRKREGGPHGR